MAAFAQRKLDFRSDTVTQPCTEMRKAIANAVVGDDYYRDDTTVLDLEERFADVMGKEAALFTTSGTQSNLLAVLGHCSRGDSFIVGKRSHIFTRECGGSAFLAGALPHAIRNREDGALDLDDVREALSASGMLFAPIRMMALENTIEGKVLPAEYLESASDLFAEYGLASHLDGARLFNAAIAQGVAPSRIAEPFDTVSVCLSKGLGAPVGSVLVGSRRLIDRARIHRQALGGGMRQAGILAAAGLYALENNRERLADDHRRAGLLADALRRIDGVTVMNPDTNIVFADIAERRRQGMREALNAAGITISGTPSRQRWVTHLGIDDSQMEAALDVLGSLAEGRA